MITLAPLFTLAATFTLLPLAFSWRLTPLTIDEHPCKPEKLKFQNRYICDSEGNVQCLTGWENRTYNVDKHFPCSQPICDPKCDNGECKLPNICSCDIGWDGLDCGTCLPLPGCVHGSCIDSDGVSEPFTCHCDDDWKGALCNIPACPQQAHCNNNGQCVVTGNNDRQCHCNLGWTSESDCGECAPSMGCVVEHTIGGAGCKTGTLDATNVLVVDEESNEPNTCQCTSLWTGPFCDQPKCTLDDGTVTDCGEYGVCTSGGPDANGEYTIPPFCRCDVGWEGENCDKCVEHYNCPNDGDSTSPHFPIAKCLQPGQCRCKEGDVTATNDYQYCTEFLADGACANTDSDCNVEEICFYGTCERGQRCAVDSDCTITGLTFCLQGLGICVECLDDSACFDGETCDLSDHVCS